MFTQMRFNLKFLSSIIFAMTFLVGGFFISNVANANSELITQIKFTNTAQTVNINTASGQLTTQTQKVVDAVDTSEQVSETTTLNLSSTSGTGEFSSNADTWIPVTTLTMSNPSANRSFYYRDSTPGTYTLTVTASVGEVSKTWTAATQTITITDSTVANVSTIGQLNTALANSNITTINMTAGEYIISQDITIAKGITLKGANTGIAGDSSSRVTPTIIKATSLNNGLSYMLDVQESNVTIDGIDFDNVRINGYNDFKSETKVVVKNNVVKNTIGTAIHFRDGGNSTYYNSNVKVLNNKIDNTTYVGGDTYNGGSGIVLMGAYDSEVSDNVILNSGYGGISLGRDKNITVSNNTVTLSAQPALQIAQWNDGTNTISGNTFSTSSTEKGAIRLYGFTNYNPVFNFTTNIIKDSKYGVQIGHEGNGKAKNDITDANYNFTGNTFTNITNHKLVVYLSSVATEGNVTEMDTLFAQVYGSGNKSRVITGSDPFKYVVNTLYVGSGKDFSTIQAAITVAVSGDTINVATGIYDLDAPITINKAITLTGDVTAPSNVKVNAPTSGDDREVFQVLANDVTIQGFTIQGSKDVQKGTSWNSNPGIAVGGDKLMLVNKPSGATDFSFNYWGFAVQDINILNNIITDNSYGIFLFHSKNVVIDGNEIHSNTRDANTWSGKGIEIYTSKDMADPTKVTVGTVLPHTNNITINDNIIRDNKLYGIELNHAESYHGGVGGPFDVDVKITNNEIYNNGGAPLDVLGGAFDYYRGISANGNETNVTVTGNIIYGHIATVGTRFGSGNAGIRLYNTTGWTIQDNEIYENMRGIYAYGTSTNVIINSGASGPNIIHDNAQGIVMGAGTTGTVNGNLIYNNNITTWQAAPNNINPMGTVNLGAGTLNVENNWWGDATPDFTALISGDVENDTYWLNEGMTLPSTLIAIFDGIHTTLEGLDIANNIDTCGTTPNSCTGLYFEKSISGVKMGRITFTASLDLTSDATKTFLQNLGDYMEANPGSIKFDATTQAGMKTAGAEIKMYG